jgi:hypothetical protein
MGGWLPVVLVFVAGALGGILNALITDNGFIFPTFATISNGARIWRPGVLGNLIVGAIAAVVSWALYSPSAGLPVGDFDAALTWAGFASAVLVGVGGASRNCRCHQEGKSTTGGQNRCPCAGGSLAGSGSLSPIMRRRWVATMY